MEDKDISIKKNSYRLLHSIFHSKTRKFTKTRLNMEVNEYCFFKIVFPFLFRVGTYCQQREVEAITENVDDDEGMI